LQQALKETTEEPESDESEEEPNKEHTMPFGGITDVRVSDVWMSCFPGAFVMLYQTLISIQYLLDSCSGGYWQKLPGALLSHYTQVYIPCVWI
jgi:hypothetical protein